MSRARVLADLLDSGGDVKLANLDNTSEYTKPSSEPITYISGLQTALDGKPDDSQLLTDVPTSAVFTDTVYSKPSSEPISYVSGLQTALNGKQASGSYLAPTGDGSQLTGIDTLPSQSSQSGKFLTTNGSAASWGDAGGGAWEFVSVLTASNSSTLEFTSLSNSFASYRFVFEDLKMGYQSRKLVGRLSTSNGSSWLGSNYWYRTKMISYSSGANPYLSGYETTQFYLTNKDLPQASQGYMGISGELQVFNLGTANKDVGMTSHIMYQESGNAENLLISGVRVKSSSSAYNGIQFYQESSGSIASGKIYMYGLKRS
jgi:hypothetical protein